MAGTGVGVELPDIRILRELSRNHLAKLLDSVSGPKDLVLDAELMRPLDRVAGASLLKEHGIDKIFKFEPGKTLSGNAKRIYMVRSTTALTRCIADQINAEKNAGMSREYKILFVPKKLHICELILEREGVLGYVTTDEFPLDLIVLDKDLLSLETPNFFRSFYLDGDETLCHVIARSIVEIQNTFGTFSNVYMLGRCAQMINELTKLMTESLSDSARGQLNAIGHLFLVDRDCDFVTPLCSQVTYEGLLDDTFSVKSGYVEFGKEVTGQDQSTKLLLTDSDPIFEEIRNRHFSNVSGFLSQKAKDLQTGYDKRHNLSSVTEMKDFVAKELRDLKAQHKSLSLHVGACEYINNSKTMGEFEDQLHTEHSLLENVDTRECVNYIEERINRQAGMIYCLRLLCLLSVTQGGLQSQLYRSLKTQFVQSFGFDTMLVLQNLRRVGLFVESGDQSQTAKAPVKLPAINTALPSQFRNLSRKLGLIPKSAEDIDLRNPNDMSYVFSGAYSPMLCKIIEQVLVKEGFTGIEDLVKSLPQPAYCECKAKSAKTGRASTASKVVLVYFLGGCTYSEVAALRFLGKQRGYKFLIATTAMINGSSLIDSVSERV